MSPRVQRFDFALIGLVLVTTLFGLIVLDGVTWGVPGLEGYARRQAMWLVIALVAFAVALVVPYDWLKWLGWPVYVATVVLLAMLLLAARSDGGLLSSVRAGGAVSWMRLSLGPVSLRFQPSEFAKIAVVIVIAHWLAWRRERVQAPRLRSLLEWIPPLMLMAVPFYIILKQPDLGTAAVFLPIPFVLLFAAGVPWRIVIALSVLGTVVILGSTVWLMSGREIPGLRKHQRERIQVFLKPLARPFRPAGIEEVLYGTPEEEQSRRRTKIDDKEWTIQQAELALGSGGLLGKGWRKGTQARYRFLPERHTDFIFSSLGEQFGLVGCLALLLLYLLIAWRCLTIAWNTTDPFGRFLVIGLLSIVMVHVFLNVAMQIRLLPVMGLPLPLISYGGSFLVTNYVIFGLVANVDMRRDSADST